VRLKYDDLPSELKMRVDAALKKEREETARREPQEAIDPPVEKRKRKGPNKTEALYKRMCIDTRPDVADCHFNGMALLMHNGHRYTTDWLVTTSEGFVELHEVKGSYRLQSYGRARLAFDQAHQEFPGFTWVWATKNAIGEFDIERHVNEQRAISVNEEG